MASPEPLERILRDFNFTYQTQIAGILTKTGLPLAIQSAVSLEEDHFATMAATLIGSTEVLYRGIGQGPPAHIAVHSPDGIMFVLNLDRNIFFVAVGGATSTLGEDLEAATAALTKVLEPLKPLEKFAVAV